MYTGLTGALKIITAVGTSKTIAYISDWSVEGKTEMIEHVSSGRADKQVTPGFKSWSASANGKISFNGNSGHAELFAAQYKGTKILFHFYLDDNENNDAGKNTYFCGEGYIESMSIDISSEDCGNISISVVGTGAMELYVDDVNVMAEDMIDNENVLQLQVRDDGYLWATVPDGFTKTVKIDDAGQLIIRI